MNKNVVVSIIGPTAVGKTELALQLTKLPFLNNKFSGFDIISADSRQVYQGLEIISGADIPNDFKLGNKRCELREYPIYQKDSASIYGLAMIEPNQEWSLAHFRKFGQEIINSSRQANRLPIVVGGTGLYHHHLFSTDPQIDILPNQEIRQKAVILTVAELQDWLKAVSAERFSQMNQSDQNNPRRLVRAIEVGLEIQNYEIKGKSYEEPTNAISQEPAIENMCNLTIGIIDSLENIQAKIEQRVAKRFKTGAIHEVERLLSLDPPPTKPALSTAGVREIEQFLQGSATETEVIEHWSRRELQYAKRQLTWWKKYGEVKWFDRQNTAWSDQVVKYLTDVLVD